MSGAFLCHKTSARSRDGAESRPRQKCSFLTIDYARINPKTHYGWYLRARYGSAIFKTPLRPSRIHNFGPSLPALPTLPGLRAGLPKKARACETLPKSTRQGRVKAALQRRAVRATPKSYHGPAPDGPDRVIRRRRRRSRRDPRREPLRGRRLADVPRRPAPEPVRGAHAIS